MVYVEVTEEQIEVLGINVGDGKTDDITDEQAEQFELWAIPQADDDFPSDLDSDLRILVLTLLISHYAEMSQRIPKTEITEDGFTRTQAGSLGETQYGQNYLAKKQNFGSVDVQFAEMRDEYEGRA